MKKYTTKEIQKDYPNSVWTLTHAKVTIKDGKIHRIDDGNWLLTKGKKCKHEFVADTFGYSPPVCTCKKCGVEA